MRGREIKSVKCMRPRGVYTLHFPNAHAYKRYAKGVQAFLRLYIQFTSQGRGRPLWPALVGQARD